MTAVADFIRRSQTELTQVTESKLEKVETEAACFIKKLEEDIMQIKQNKLQLNKFSLGNDAFFLGSSTR